ncbi:hypothetical protein G7Y89_g15030 [Cudoniella acicularis]|uniref:Uncharacterized protein n=1 Tax=Cudoniella acicularis TaxID=354080 RepID=A0A8H4VQ50_9HELO|nr:hypothetical protein G7Y89_g15030 [Cudoniella acicularis]
MSDTETLVNGLSDSDIPNDNKRASVGRKAPQSNRLRAASISRAVNSALSEKSNAMYQRNFPTPNVTICPPTSQARQTATEISKIRTYLLEIRRESICMHEELNDKIENIEEERKKDQKKMEAMMEMAKKHAHRMEGEVIQIRSMMLAAGKSRKRKLGEDADWDEEMSLKKRIRGGPPRGAAATLQPLSENVGNSSSSAAIPVQEAQADIPAQVRLGRGGPMSAGSSLSNARLSTAAAPNASPYPQRANRFSGRFENAPNIGAADPNYTDSSGHSSPRVRQSPPGDESPSRQLIREATGATPRMRNLAMSAPNIQFPNSQRARQHLGMSSPPQDQLTEGNVQRMGSLSSLGSNFSGIQRPVRGSPGLSQVNSLLDPPSVDTALLAAREKNALATLEAQRRILEHAQRHGLDSAIDSIDGQLRNY